MSTALFVNEIIGLSENLFLVKNSQSKPVSD